MTPKFHFVLVCYIEDEESDDDPRLIRGQLRNVTPGQQHPDTTTGVPFEGVDSLPELLRKQIADHRKARS